MIGCPRKFDVHNKSILARERSSRANMRFEHRLPKLKIRDKRRERDSSVSAYKVVLCYNHLNYKDLYGKTTDLF